MVQEAGIENIKILFMIVLFNLSTSLLWSQPEGFQKESSSDNRIQSSQDHVFGRSFLFDSRNLDEEKKIFIKLPEAYSEGINRYPVIYILDFSHYDRMNAEVTGIMHL